MTKTDSLAGYLAAQITCSNEWKPTRAVEDSNERITQWHTWFGDIARELFVQRGMNNERIQAILISFQDQLTAHVERHMYYLGETMESEAASRLTIADLRGQIQIKILAGLDADEVIFHVSFPEVRDVEHKSNIVELRTGFVVDYSI